MNESMVEPASSNVRSSAQGATPKADGALVEQLKNALGESALLQAQLNQVFASRLVDLDKRAREARDALGTSLRTLEKLIRETNGRIESLTASVPFSGRFVAPVGNDLWLIKVLNSFLMYVETTDMSVAPHLVADGCWEKCITEAFKARLKPGMVVVDVGANYGYYTLLAASYVGWSGRSMSAGRVYAFEPNPRTFEVLIKNIQVNWLGSIVRAHQLAVLDSRKQVELHILHQFQGSTSVFEPLFQPEADPPREQRPVVDGVPLDEIISDKVDLMKIDAEGSEPLVLEGMRGILDRSPNLTIFMEFNIPMIQQSVDPRMFLNRIRALGFSLEWFTPWNTLEPFEEEEALKFDRFDLLLERK